MREKKCIDQDGGPAIFSHKDFRDLDYIEGGSR